MEIYERIGETTYTLRAFAPRGVFTGRNFMTPKLIGYMPGTVRGKRAWIEISEGTGIYDQPIFGVTFRRPDGGELWREGANRCDLAMDPSKVFQTKSDALEYASEFVD